MAETKIKHSDLIEDKIFDPTIKSGEEMLGVIVKLKSGFQDVLKVSQQFLKSGTPKNTKELEDFEKTINKISVAEKALIEIEKQKLKSEQELLKVQKQKTNLRDEEIANNDIDRKAKKDRIDLLKAEITESLKSVGTLQKLEAANTKLRIERKGLNIETAQGKARLLEINAALDKNNAFIKENSDKLKQQKLNVGNYKESIKEAFRETGFFNSGIGRLVAGLGELKKKFEENAESTKKFSANLKLGIAGGIALAVVALKELADINQSVKDGFEGFAAWVKDLGSGGEATQNLVRQTQAWRIEVLKLKEALLGVSLNEQDFIEISNDVTIGFQERNEALLKSIELSKERAKISVDIAQKEFDLAEQALAADSARITSGSEDVELLKKKFEAQERLTDALDVQDDLTRQNAQRERALNVARASAEIDLLLKKKQSANAQKVILENQLADEKIQLGQRKNIAEGLNKVNLNTTNEEIKLFKKFIKIEFDETKLLGEQDARILKNKLEGLRTLEGKGLGVEATAVLAKIIKQAQEDQIKNAETIAKFDEEELRRKQKIAEIESEIAKIQLEDRINDNEILLNERVLAYETGTEKILQNNLLFRGKQRATRNADFEIIKADQERINELKAEQLNANAETEKTAILNNVNDKQIQAEEIKKIEAQLQIDLENLRIGGIKREQELNKKKSEDDRKIREAEIQRNYETLQTINDAVFDGLQERSQKKQDAISTELSENEKAISRQNELAAKGLDNQVAFEEAKKTKLALELKRKRENERQQEEAAQLTSAFLEFLKERSKENPNTAPARALSDVLIAKSISKGIANIGSYEGADSIGEEHSIGSLNRSKDNLLIPLHKGERVVGFEDSQKIKGMTNKEVVRGAELYKQGFYMPEGLQDVSKSSQVDNAMAVMLSKKISELNTTLKNKREYNVDWNSHGERVEQVVENGMKLVIRKVTTGKPRI